MTFLAYPIINAYLYHTAPLQCNLYDVCYFCPYRKEKLLYFFHSCLKKSITQLLSFQEEMSISRVHPLNRTEFDLVIFPVRHVLHSPHMSWLNLTVLNPTAPCCIMANLYLSPPLPGELTFPEGCAPSAHRQACHAPLGAHHTTDSSWQAVMAANKEPAV